MLKQHNKKDDAWSAFNGKVYNMTWYLLYHPGGEKELMRVAGRDGTKLFCTSPLQLLCACPVSSLLLCFISSDPRMGQRRLHVGRMFGRVFGS